MEAVCSYETLVSTFKSTWCYNPEDQHHQVPVVKVCIISAANCRFCMEIEVQRVILNFQNSVFFVLRHENSVG
jgi:hypothetical protein